VDILVEFSEVPGIFGFLRLERYLSEILGRKVDLVEKSALKPRIGHRILNEVLYV
jgi:predicted nucleotidyltransferase